MTASIHKLSAGDGYTYLTRQVAASDATTLGSSSLADYYTEKGERPGVWVGRGLTGIDGVAQGDRVSEAQMRALFGEGLHPNAGEIQATMIREGAGKKRIARAISLGRAYRQYDAAPLTTAVAQACREYNRAKGGRENAAIPEDVRVEIRTRTAREMFVATYRRMPFDSQELTGFVAREGRKDRQAVAGFDMTFSPVKSVSSLWAVAPRQVADEIAAAHDAAVKSALDYLEDEVAFTRRGTNGVRQVDVSGITATAFTHRDTRSGDPDLHTHVAIANRVQDSEGHWLTLDARVLYRATVSVSERYNSALEAELQRRLGVRFAPREEQQAGRKRSVREVVGAPQELLERWSTRSFAIDARANELAEEFTAKHGRIASPAEMIKLRQQANLDTREAKHEPRAEADQRKVWRAEAAAVVGGEEAVEAVFAAALNQSLTHERELSKREIRQLAGRCVGEVEERRARWNDLHIRSEAERAVRSLRVAPSLQEATVAAVVQAALSLDEVSVVSLRDHIQVPASLQRRDGSSVYDVAHSALHTSRATLDAEREIVQAARASDGRRLTDTDVEIALLESVANGVQLNPGQERMVREMATSGARVQLALAPAGSGKTTSMRALARAWQASGGTIIGLAPSAAAAGELGESMSVTADTLAILIHRLDKGSELPEWAKEVNQDSLIVIDEAGMASTKDLHRVIEFATSRGASVRLVGDDQQLASVAAGGVLRDIQSEVGAVSLRELMRFADPAEAVATLAVREGDISALGYYLDHGRIHVGPDGSTLDQVTSAWIADREKGLDATMMAFSRDAANELNLRAQAWRIEYEAAGGAGERARLASGLEAGVGDVILTRQNDRALRFTETDWVKNGDRWVVTGVTAEGGLRAKHLGSGHNVMLPDKYVTTNVDLGYATTIHSAQGSTVDVAHVAITGQEDRQSFYVAVSRGRQANHIYLEAGTEGDPHDVLRPEYVAPQSPIEVLEEVLGRDGAQRSATTELRDSASAWSRLQRHAPLYDDALGQLAAGTLTPERRAEIGELANEFVATYWTDGNPPVLTDDSSWDTLLGHLALIELGGDDPLAILEEAIKSREMGSAERLGAVLDWRLDRRYNVTGAGVGSLPWLDAVPTQLSDAAQSFLNAHAEQIRAGVSDIRQHFADALVDELPSWAQPFEADRSLVADLAMWRATQMVPDTDLSPTGPRHPSLRLRRHQSALEKRARFVVGGGNSADDHWIHQLHQLNADVAHKDPFWPVVAQRLSSVAARGVDLDSMLGTVLSPEERELPAEHAAAALWFRLVNLADKEGIDMDSRAVDQPPWAQKLEEELPEHLGRQLMRKPEWAVVVAAVERAATRHGVDAEAVVVRAVELLDPSRIDAPSGIPSRDLAQALIAQLADLQRPILVQDEREAEPAEQLSEDAPTADDLAAHYAMRELDPAAPENVESVLRASTLDEPPATELYDPTTALSAEDVEWLSSRTSPERIVQLNEQAAGYYRTLYDNSPASSYVTERFDDDLGDVAGLVIGFTGQNRAGLSSHLIAQGATPDELIDAGLAKTQRRGELVDLMRNRVVLGIHDATSGELVGFTGRALPGLADPRAPKYLNTPGTAAFRKGATLFGWAENLDVLQKGATPVIVEGPFDAIATTIASGGCSVGLAPMGTALTDAQCDLLSGIGSNRVMLATDNDQAGRTAMERDYWKLASRGIDSRVLTLLRDVKDPAEAFAADADQLAQILDLYDYAPTAASHVLAAHVSIARGRFDNIYVQVKVARECAQIIAALPPEQWEEHVEIAAELMGTPDALFTILTATADAGETVLATRGRPASNTTSADDSTSYAESVQHERARLEAIAQQLAAKTDQAIAPRTPNEGPPVEQKRPTRHL